MAKIKARVHNVTNISISELERAIDCMNEIDSLENLSKNLKRCISKGDLYTALNKIIEYNKIMFHYHNTNNSHLCTVKNGYVCKMCGKYISEEILDIYLELANSVLDYIDDVENG